LLTPEGSSPKTLPVSIPLKSDPAWDEKGSGVGRRQKTVSALVEKNINMTAPVLLKKILAQTHRRSRLAEPKTWPSAETYKK
jgi:hypothetical protein